MNPGTVAPESLLSVYVNTLEKSNQPACGPGAREGVARKGRGARGAAGDGRTQEGRGGGAAGGAAAVSGHLGLNRNCSIVDSRVSRIIRHSRVSGASSSLSIGARGWRLGPWASRAAAGSREFGSPEPGVRCHGDPGGRGGRSAGSGAAGRGALCAGHPRARPPLKCPQESWTRLDTPARSLRAPGSPHLVFSGASALSLPPGRRARWVPERLPLHASTPPRAGTLVFPALRPSLEGSLGEEEEEQRPLVITFHA